MKEIIVGTVHFDIDQGRRLRSAVEIMSRAFRGWWRGIVLLWKTLGHQIPSISPPTKIGPPVKRSQTEFYVQTSGGVRIARRISAVAFCCSRASSRSWVRHAISVSRPVARPRTLGALRRFCTTSLRCRAFVGSPPALERRLIAFLKAQDKAL